MHGTQEQTLFPETLRDHSRLIPQLYMLFGPDFLDSLSQSHPKGKPSLNFLTAADILSLATFVSDVSGTILLYQVAEKYREWEMTPPLNSPSHPWLIQGCHAAGLFS